MLLLSKDSIVRLEVVFLQKLLAVVDLNIEKGVAHAEERISLGRHSGTNERKGVELLREIGVGGQMKVARERLSAK